MASSPGTILITGASSGLGAALARRYAAPGIRLALTGRNPERLGETAAACRASGAAVETALLDVTERQALADWILEIDAATPIGLVIANAGISNGSTSGESQEAVRRVFAVNLEGVLNSVLPLLPRMIARGAGQIALMSSLAGFRGLPDAPAYSASKAALKSLGEAWRGQLAPAGLRVSVICPGFVTTPMTDNLPRPLPFLMNAERAAAIIERGLAGNRSRIAFPWPMACAVWLLSALPPALADFCLRPRLARHRA